MPKITRIEPAVPEIKARKKVAAYARISMESERMNHSLSAQISYYSSLIQKNPDWQYAGVFADDGISGTGIARRDAFRRMVEAAENGEIDIILTKSIQRFARNTVDLLETVRHLKDIGVEVRFEKEHINSLSGDGELMLTILASYAQEESRSISENIKWSMRKRFEQGIPNGRFHIYGYRWEGDHLVIEPEEAKIVRLIYNNFLNGLSAESTEKQLEEMGVTSYKGMHFGNMSIRRILTNITYTGNLLLQKEYISDPINGKSKINRGELPQYFVQNTHEAIIPMETYQAVQKERERRRALGALANWSINTSCFTSKIKCGICGKSYRRNRGRRRKDPNRNRYFWVCRTKNEKGPEHCAARNISEKQLKEVCTEVLGTDGFDEATFSEKVERIVVSSNDILVFHFYDGTVLEKRRIPPACSTGAPSRNKAKNPNRRGYSEFTKFIKCERCGENFRCQCSKHKDGTAIQTWHCGNHCGNTTIREEVLKKMVCDVLKMKEFSGERMEHELENITVDGQAVTFRFQDNHTESREYIKPKKKGVKHTEEFKAHISEITKARWREGTFHGSKKSDDNSGNNQPVHGSTD